MVNSNPLDSDTDPCSPSVYYCNISSFQSWVTSHVYMTPISGTLAVFASKNKEVVQNPNSSSRVEAVSTRVEFDLDSVIVVSPTTWEAHHSPRAPSGCGELPRSLVTPQ